eukprot:m.7115 g.7115  ORF g.7115 m.7115 type:complete len:447 (+) comp2710_c0_seq1:59-1399(+)
MDRGRGMTVGNTYGKKFEGVCLMIHGKIRTKKKPHFCLITRSGELRIHSGGDSSYDVQHLIKLKDIHSVGLSSSKDKTEFVICCPQGSFRMFAPSAQDAEHWIFALNPPKRQLNDDGTSVFDAQERGWLTINKKKYYCELRKTSIILFEDQQTSDPIGAIALDSLCTVVPPTPMEDQSRLRRMTSVGVTFHINTAGKQWAIMSRTEADIDRWMSAVQDVIETAPTLTTKFEKYLIQNQQSDPFTLDEVFLERAVLCFGDEALDSPLLPLSYGKIGKGHSGNEYGYPHFEAMDLFNSFIPDEKSRFGNIVQGEKWMRNVLIVSYDAPPLRNEIFCQAIKQVCKVPSVYARYSINYWKMLALLCAHLVPSQRILNYLRCVLHHAAQHKEYIDIIRGCANYCLTCLQEHRPKPSIDDEVFDNIVSGRIFTETKADNLVLDESTAAEEEV